ncbi:hypothetical protein C2E19_12400 [Pseudomonas sp. DTU12.3]|nr:hypothetical protein C2E19_12400 [Pseudomonas sp. DTU12.3]
MCQRFRERPTPTFDFGNVLILHSSALHCGSGLARESVRSGEIAVECADAFVSKPTPTLDSVLGHILPSNMAPIFAVLI